MEYGLIYVLTLLHISFFTFIRRPFAAALTKVKDTLQYTGPMGFKLANWVMHITNVCSSSSDGSSFDAKGCQDHATITKKVSILGMKTTMLLPTCWRDYDIGPAN
jgi:hypothetical protein